MAKRKRVNSTTSNESIPVAPAHILDLNDDCLRHILSFLPTIALCAVQDTCQRLDALAKQHFIARYRHQPVIFAPKFDDFAARANFSDATKVLRHFGQLIRALSVHNITEEEHSAQWGEIFGHCTHLIELRVSGCVLRFLYYYPRVTDTIANLTLNKCMGNDEDFNNVIYSFQNLKRMTVEYGHYGLKTGFLRGRIPSLDEITIRSIRKNALHINSVLPFFIMANQQLKRIYCNFNHVKCDILDVIAANSRDLESLTLQLYDNCREPFPEDIAKLRRLQHLRELQISCAAYKESIHLAIGALAVPNLLHTLSISNTKITFELCLAFIGMTNLKTLKLVEMSVEKSLENSLGIPMKEMKLEHLHVIACQQIHYKHMVELIEKSKTLRSLTFSCACACDPQIDVTWFTELISARNSSGSSSTLDIFLPFVVLKNLTKNVREAMTSDKCVQLKRMDEDAEYVYAFFIVN